MDYASSILGLLPTGRRSIGVTQLLNKLETYLPPAQVDRCGQPPLAPRHLDPLAADPHLRALELPRQRDAEAPVRPASTPPATSETSVDVPPPSSDKIRVNPAASARCADPSAPAAGPLSSYVREALR